MALIVETGAGVTGANTYQDVATAKASALELGITFGSASESTIAGALLAGAMRVDTFPLPYSGVALGRMAFPRRGLVDRQGRVVAEDVVPDGVPRAQLFYAVEHLRQPFLGVPAADPSIKRTKVEDIEVEYFAGRQAVSPLPMADGLLAQYTPASGDWVFQDTVMPLPIYGSAR